jgi:hypothetical protein
MAEADSIFMLHMIHNRFFFAMGKQWRAATHTTQNQGSQTSDIFTRLYGLVDCAIRFVTLCTGDGPGGGAAVPATCCCRSIVHAAIAARWMIAFVFSSTFWR